MFSRLLSHLNPLYQDTNFVDKSARLYSGDQKRSEMPSNDTTLKQLDYTLLALPSAGKKSLSIVSLESLTYSAMAEKMFVLNSGPNLPGVKLL